LGATIGIFLPSFLLVGFLFPLFDKLRNNAKLATLLDGINAASIALMAAVTVKLGMATLISWQAGLIFAISAVLLVKYKINSTYLIVGGALLGLLL
jgi:chromate transporter